MTGRAAVDRVADAHGVVQHRKHEHPGGGRGDEQPACGLDPAEARQTQVHEHDVRGVGDEPGKGGFSGAVRSDDAHAAAPGEDGFDAVSLGRQRWYSCPDATNPPTRADRVRCPDRAGKSSRSAHRATHRATGLRGNAESLRKPIATMERRKWRQPRRVGLSSCARVLGNLRAARLRCVWRLGAWRRSSRGCC